MTKQKVNPIISVVSLVFPIWWISRMWQINKLRKALFAFVLLFVIVISSMYLGNYVGSLSNILGLIAISEILGWLGIMAYFTNQWVEKYNKSITQNSA